MTQQRRDEMTKIRIEEIAYHRNGVGGAPFHVIRFRDGKRKMLGIVFEEPNTVAVFDRALLAGDVIAFGHNSWRGDDYESHLRKAIHDAENEYFAVLRAEGEMAMAIRFVNRSK